MILTCKLSLSSQSSSTWISRSSTVCRSRREGSSTIASCRSFTARVRVDDDGAITRTPLSRSLALLVGV